MKLLVIIKFAKKKRYK